MFSYAKHTHMQIVDSYLRLWKEKMQDSISCAIYVVVIRSCMTKCKEKNLRDLFSKTFKRVSRVTVKCNCH